MASLKVRQFRKLKRRIELGVDKPGDLEKARQLARELGYSLPEGSKSSRAATVKVPENCRKDVTGRLDLTQQG